jgi:hypothetical protein
MKRLLLAVILGSAASGGYAQDFPRARSISSCRIRPEE